MRVLRQLPATKQIDLAWRLLWGYYIRDMRTIMEGEGFKSESISLNFKGKDVEIGS